MRRDSEDGYTFDSGKAFRMDRMEERARDMMGRCNRCGEFKGRLFGMWARGKYGAWRIFVCRTCEPRVQSDPSSSRATDKEIEWRHEQEERARRDVGDVLAPPTENERAKWTLEWERAFAVRTARRRRGMEALRSC